jgi:hypothetical protein
MDNMNEKQYNDLINDIAEAVVKLMIKKQAEYDAQFKIELEKKYGYEVEFKSSDEEFMTPEEEIEFMSAALEQALREERYEDAAELQRQIKLIKNKK